MIKYIYDSEPFQILAKMEALTDQSTAKEFIDMKLPWKFYSLLVDFAEEVTFRHAEEAAGIVSAKRP